ncbi:EamA family transporter [Fertoebacter nigrum]|uniref:EamA family transporter n=1 Tax=Fertoeibacter niger TaxID=2656921 RepID=A0A8X8GT82_9RHOB|nr:DMT family transporter [Fertoeibacter niger]NUB43908.1 EamA family transporter [Fertoeibacter niger]
MTAWLVSIEGTALGAQIAMGLALVSAFAHACFGAIQKGRHDPWATRGAIDLWMVVLSLPMALFLVPWPQGFEWLVVFGALGIHFAYKLTMALAYERAAYTVVYPVVRGTGPLATLAFAALFLGEAYAPLQWLGVALLSGAILMLAGLNLRGAVVGRDALRTGLVWAFAGGLLVAVYTTYDAWGIRLTPDPFTFLAWFFLIGSLDFPALMAVRLARRGVWPGWNGALMTRGLIGALVAFVSFGGVMLGTRLGKVGEVAALRETSTLFAALIGWAVLHEKTTALRVALMGLIAFGAILVQAAG